jgi:hypothetical protein
MFLSGSGMDASCKIWFGSPVFIPYKHGFGTPPVHHQQFSRWPQKHERRSFNGHLEVQKRFKKERRSSKNRIAGAPPRKTYPL